MSIHSAPTIQADEADIEVNRELNESIAYMNRLDHFSRDHILKFVPRDFKKSITKYFSRPVPVKKNTKKKEVRVKNLHQSNLFLGKYHKMEVMNFLREGMTRGQNLESTSKSITIDVTSIKSVIEDQLQYGITQLLQAKNMVGCMDTVLWYVQGMAFSSITRQGTSSSDAAILLGIVKSTAFKRLKVAMLVTKYPKLIDAMINPNLLYSSADTIEYLMTIDGSLHRHYRQASSLVSLNLSIQNIQIEDIGMNPTLYDELSCKYSHVPATGADEVLDIIISAMDDDNEMLDDEEDIEQEPDDSRDLLDYFNPDQAFDEPMDQSIDEPMDAPMDP